MFRRPRDALGMLKRFASAAVQDLAEPQRIVGDRGRPVKHGRRARKVPLAVERFLMLEIARRVGISPLAMRRRQQRFAEDGCEGLLRHRTRPLSIPPAPQAEAHAMIEQTSREPCQGLITASKPERSVPDGP